MTQNPFNALLQEILIQDVILLIDMTFTSYHCGDGISKLFVIYIVKLKFNLDLFTGVPLWVYGYDG